MHFRLGALPLTLGLLGATSAMSLPWPMERSRPVSPLPTAPALDQRRAALGEALFRDPRLSAHGRVSCQSCHDDRTNGASAAAHDIGDDGSTMRFNTPTLYNVALNFRLGWEGRTRALPAMVKGSLESPHVMGGGRASLQRLQGDPALSGQSRQAYGRGLDEAVAIDAIATYLRSLVTPGARFDRWLEGDATALTVEEKRGWMRFQSVGCAACHQGVNVGGNLFQRHGVFHPLAAPDPAILRVPSLRNVATTAPYFHDGSAADLSSAIRAMGHAQLDVDLSGKDIRDIKAFLGALTGERNGRRVTAPGR